MNIFDIFKKAPNSILGRVKRFFTQESKPEPQRLLSAFALHERETGKVDIGTVTYDKYDDRIDDIYGEIPAYHLPSSAIETGCIKGEGAIRIEGEIVTKDDFTKQRQNLYDKVQDILSNIK